MSRKFTLRRAALALVAPFLLLACDDDEPTAPKDDLTQLREATAKYASVSVAEGAGYSGAGQACVAAPPGGMGFHYTNAALVGINPQSPVGPDGRVTGSDGKIELLKPEVILYAPTANGGREMVGVEYMVFEAAWKAAGNTAAPRLFGTDFEYAADNPATPFDEAHGFAPHYELHVWSVRENPAGLTAAFNTGVSCG